MRRALAILLAGAVCGFPQAASAQGSGFVRAPNLLNLCWESRIIVAGRVESVRRIVDPQNGHPALVVTLANADLVRKEASPLPATAGRYVFRQYDGPGFRTSDAALPDYRVGERVLLFLAGHSKLRLTAPLGLGHGKFQIHAYSKGRASRSLVANESSNAHLALTGPLSPPAAARLRRVALSAWERDVLNRTSSGPLDYPQFLRLVRKLVRAAPAGGQPGA